MNLFNPYPIFCRVCEKDKQKPNRFIMGICHNCLIEEVREK